MNDCLTLKPKNRQVKNHVKAGANFALRLCLIIFGMLFLPLGAYAAENSDSYFNQLRKTLALPPESLMLSASGQEFTFADINSTWWSHNVYLVSHKHTHKFGNTINSLPNLVQKQLGIGNPWQAYAAGQQVLGFTLDRKAIADQLHNTITPILNQASQSAVLEIENDQVVAFQPHTIGQSVDLPATIKKINRALFIRATTTAPAVVSTKPPRTLSQTNSLGIKELVAHGESDFSGSTRSRINNIQVGAARFNGVLLKPGQEFSFNQYLGEVTADTGFLPELVIKSFGTIPELGGGLCQVSTTAFRAALFGGLKITERKNHSYAVKYYAPQGTDATIYPGVVDFKFINDTVNHLLIATYIEGNILNFDFYGTKDNRQVAIDGPHHYAYGPGGAMKANLSRTVTLNDETLEDEFFSNYVSQDLFPRVFEFPTPPPQPEVPADPVGESVEESVEEPDLTEIEG